MIKELYIHCYVACLIGNIIHLAALYRSRAIDYEKNNERLSVKQFLIKEMPGIVLDFVGSMGLVYVADEWIDSPYVMGKIKTAFVIVGISGSWAVMQLASQTKKQFRAQIDKKSDIADGKTDK